MSNHQLASNSTFEMKIRTSDFIDCPAGDVNVIIKNISTNNQSLFSEQNYIRVELLSKVDRLKVLLESHRKDVCESLALTTYHLKPSKEDNFNTILLDHVSNLISRHFEDQISIKILSKQDRRQNIFTNEREDRVIAHTDIPLSQLSLHSKKTQSYNIITVGSQRIKQKPVYYKIALDVIYHSKNSRSPSQSPLEQATENYKLMMGKDQLTPMENQILQMLMERQEIAAQLTPACLRMRRARFFMRNLWKVQYGTIDGQSKVNMLVSPLTFLF